MPEVTGRSGTEVLAPEVLRHRIFAIVSHPELERGRV